MSSEAGRTVSLLAHVEGNLKFVKEGYSEIPGRSHSTNLIVRFRFFRKWKPKGKDVLLVNTLMYVYLSFVLYFTLMPVIASLPLILNHPYKLMNMVPFGFLFPMTRNHAIEFRRTVFFCFLISLGVELLQPLMNGFRSADITDLITNIIGGMVDYVLYIAFRPITPWVLARLRK